MPSHGLLSEMVSVVGLDTTSAGTFTLNCNDGGSDANAINADLVAVQLSSAAGAVTGG